MKYKCYDPLNASEEEARSYDEADAEYAAESHAEYMWDKGGHDYMGKGDHPVIVICPDGEKKEFSVCLEFNPSFHATEQPKRDEMTITLKLVELENSQFAIMRKDGFGDRWYFSEIATDHKSNDVNYSSTWCLELGYGEYCFVPTQERGEDELNKVYEALMTKNKKVKILRTIKILKVKV